MEEKPNVISLGLDGKFSSEESSEGSDGEDVIWDQKSWLTFVEESLLYLSSCEDPDPKLYSTEKHVLRRDFGESPAFFCYIYKGNFLPSGDSDGFRWKPSQSAKQAMGSRVMKRYFYQKDKGDTTGVNRQVSWIPEHNQWNFIEYKSKIPGNAKIPMNTIQGPEGFDWTLLYRKVKKFHRRRASIVSAPEEISKPRKREKRRHSIAGSTPLIEEEYNNKRASRQVSPSKFSLAVFGGDMDRLSTGVLSLSAILGKEDPFKEDYQQEQLTFNLQSNQQQPLTISDGYESKEEMPEGDYRNVLDADLSFSQLSDIYDEFTSSGVFPRSRSNEENKDLS